MTERQAIRDIMKLRGWSQQKLADECGFKHQTNVASLLNENPNTKGMRVDNLFKLIDAMGCEIVIRDKMGSKKEWVITSTPDLTPAPTIEELLQAGKITFDEAFAKGWRPSPEMLTKMLG
jgi:transcriptional regulator with XRE-family HTH domain